ncbi:hypothetical protein [Dongia sp.]|uniref:hypothetical protein n=1 Tax=Dongia sp. TaxID=1977262 RepID=UPI0035B0F62A
MGRWWNADRMGSFGLACKTSLAAGSVVALLLVAACGDKEEQAAGGQSNSTETAAPAAAIDAAKAPIIQKAIDDYLLLAEGPEATRILRHGAVKVTPGTDAFDVSIEGVTLGTADDTKLDIGTVSYKLTPKGDDAYIASDLRHANVITAKDKNNAAVGSLAVTTKSFTGEWSSSLETFLSFDWQATDLSAKDDKPEGGNVAAKTLNVTLSSTDKGGGLFDQNGKLQLTGFSALDNTGGTLNIGELNFTGIMSAVKLKEYVAKTREMQTLMAEIAEAAAKAQANAEGQQGDATAAPTEASGMSPEQATKFGTLIKGVSGLLGGVKYDITVNDAGFKEKDGSEPFRLGQGGLTMAFDGLDKEKAVVNLGISHDKLSINDPELTADPLFTKLLPASGKLDLNLSEVPSKELWQLIGDNFPNLVAADAAHSDAAAGIMFIAMQQLLQKAPMKLTVAPSGLNSEVLQLDATGNFDVKPDATLGLVGALDVGLHGLDEALNLVKEAAQSSPNAAQIMGGLSMIQSMAKRETGGDGKPVDKLKLEVDAAGDAKVNGMSLSGM